MERRDKVINEKTYQILVPSVRKSMPLCTRGAALLTPILGSLVPLAKTLRSEANKQGWEMFSEALQDVKIDPEKLDKLFMDAVEASHLCCEGESISGSIAFEKHFTTHRGDVYQVCAWALWEVVKDFFPQLGAFSQIAKKAATEAASKYQKGGAQTTG